MSVFTKRPTDEDAINAALTKLLGESGLSPYIPGDTRKITALIKGCGLKIFAIEHGEDRVFHNKYTGVEYYTFDEIGDYDFAYFVYDWG